MSHAEAFLAEIDAFLARTEMTPTAFGWQSVKDPNFVSDLRERGRSPSLALVDRVHEFIRTHDAERTPPAPTVAA